MAEEQIARRPSSDHAPASQGAGPPSALLVLLLRARDATTAGSPARSFTTWATPRLARSPTTPSADRIESAMIGSAPSPIATSGRYRSDPDVSSRKTALVSARHQVLRALADTPDHRIEFEQPPTSRPSSARAAISVPRRCASSKSRAFSSATLRLPAIVVAVARRPR